MAQSSLIIFAFLAQSTVATRTISRLQPQLVAHSLAAVEEEWKQQADVFVECNDTAKDAQESETLCKSPAEGFKKSCSKIVAAVVQSSDGERSRVTDYLNTVCGEKELGTGWKQQQCSSLANVIASKMSAEALNNREFFDSEGLCKNFWPQFIIMEQDAVRKERADRLEKAKKEAEETAAREKLEAEEKAAREKKEAEEAAEREKQETEARAVAEKAAAAAKAQAEDEAAKNMAAQKTAELVRSHKAKAEEAKRKAQASAERLAKNKAEAKEMEEEAALHQREAVAATAEAERVEAQHSNVSVAVHVNTTEAKVNTTEASVQANVTAQNETKAVVVNATK